MEIFLSQIEESLKSNLYFLSLYSALTIPDIAGALESPSGEAHSNYYKKWFDKWVAPIKAPSINISEFPQNMDERLRTILTSITQEVELFNGERCWEFRCTMLHQGRLRPNPHKKTNRILFVEPDSSCSNFHYNKINDALLIDVTWFCKEMIAAARNWLHSVQNDPNYIQNSKQVAQRYENGLPPYIIGVPVIG